MTRENEIKELADKIAEFPITTGKGSSRATASFLYDASYRHIDPSKLRVLSDIEIEKAEESGMEKFGEALHEYRMGREEHPKPSVDFIYNAIAQAQFDDLIKQILTKR